MSFLHDPKIYSTIVERLLKKAQENVARPVDANAVAKKLADNLARELSGTEARDNITAATNTGITIDHLTSLPTFLQFLSQNKLKINGQQIVYTQDEANSLPDASHLFQIDELYVNLPLLTKYVNHLQDKAKEDDNILLETSLGNLIDQVNAIAPEAKLSKTREKSTPESPNALPDMTIVDRFQKNIFDPKNPLANSGNINLLHVKDLKSAGALNAWLRTSDSYVVMYDQGQAKTVSFLDPSANRCIIPQVLYKRALQFYNTGNEEERRLYSFYMKRIQDIVGQFTGPDNQPCTIEGVVAPTTTAPADQSATSFAQLIQSVPLRMGDIDFQRIKFFFDQYKKFYGAKLNSGVQTAMNNALQVMNVLSTGKVLSNPAMDKFNLNAGPEEIKTLLAAPPGQHYLQLLEYLQSILVNTGYVLRDLQSAFGEKNINQNLKNILGQQIGFASGAGSIYGENLNDIMRLKSLVKL